MCDSGSYVNGMQVRYNEKILLTDNTALNGIALICRDPYEPAFVSETKTLEFGNWGIWRLKTYSDELFVCGAEARYDDY